MKKYAAVISYIGTNTCGWQRQKGSAAQGSISIQEQFEAALRKMTDDDRASVVASGRTDAGVHAMGQVVHFVLRKKTWSTDIIKKGLNSLLPLSIRVVRVVQVADDFHAQRSALKKQYSYYFLQAPCHFPHLEPYSRWIKRELDVKAMQKALNFLKGEHDFLAFRASGGKEGSSVREILEAKVTVEPLVHPMAPEDAYYVRIRVVGTGFLKQMVRGIAGTLQQIGEGRRPPECMLEILETRERKLVGPTAQPQALWLEKVWYPGGEPS